MSTKAVISVERVSIEGLLVTIEGCKHFALRVAHCERRAMRKGQPIVNRLAPGVSTAGCAAPEYISLCFLRRCEQRGDAPALGLLHAKNADEEMDYVGLRLEPDSERERHVDIGRAVIDLDDGGVGEIRVDMPHLGKLKLGHAFDERVRAPEGHAVADPEELWRVDEKRPDLGEIARVLRRCELIVDGADVIGYARL